MLGLEPVVRAYIAWSIDQRGGLSLDALTAIWPIVVGRSIALRTRPKGLRGRQLEVGVPDSIWASELSFQSEKILSRLNGHFPDGVRPIEVLRFTIGGHPAEVPAGRRRREVEVVTPLTDEHRDALEQIADPELRDIVARLIECDSGRLDEE